MNTFVNAVKNQSARTENGMKARASTADACVDLFFKAGAMRGKDVTPVFAAAYAEDKELALRIAAWVRDVRGGAGERQVFRQILKYLDKCSPADAVRLLAKAPELGRWDDVLEVESGELKQVVFGMVKNALAEGNGLCAKWMPRKGKIAEEMRAAFGWSPKFYRKRLVELTNVVEQKMCAKQWDDINFSQVPSVASARYKKAFYRNATEAYTAYVAELVKDPKDRTIDVKVNAGAVYPYDVIKGVSNFHWKIDYNTTERNLIVKQWEALENFMGDANVLPLVDVSGSMSCPAGRNSSVTCLDVAVSLGLYCADKNTGKFKDTFLTFSGAPQLVHLKGNVIEKAAQMVKSTWAMNTDLVMAMEKILSVAKEGQVPQEEMPAMLLIMSDMQFDRCATLDYSAMEMIRRKFETAGYEVPKIVFWNINAYDNVPVKYDDRGVALVSGFSPSIMKAVLAANMEDFTPRSIMLKTVMNPRYEV